MTTASDITNISVKEAAQTQAGVTLSFEKTSTAEGKMMAENEGERNEEEVEQEKDDMMKSTMDTDDSDTPMHRQAEPTAPDDAPITQPELLEEAVNSIPEDAAMDGQDNHDMPESRIDDDDGDATAEPAGTDGPTISDLIAGSFETILDSYGKDDGERLKPSAERAVHIKEMADATDLIMTQWLTLTNRGITKIYVYAKAAEDAVRLAYDDDDKFAETIQDKVRKAVGYATARVVEQGTNLTEEDVSLSRMDELLGAIEAGMLNTIERRGDELKKEVDDVEAAEQKSAAEALVQLSQGTWNPVNKRKASTTPSDSEQNAKRPKRAPKKTTGDNFTAPSPGPPPPTGGTPLGRMGSDYPGGNTSFAAHKARTQSTSASNTHVDTSASSADAKPQKTPKRKATTAGKSEIKRKTSGPKWGLKEELVLMEAKADTAEWNKKPANALLIEGRENKHNTWTLAEGLTMKNDEGAVVPLARSWNSMEQHIKKFNGNGVTIEVLKKKIETAEKAKKTSTEVGETDTKENTDSAGEEGEKAAAETTDDDENDESAEEKVVAESVMGVEGDANAKTGNGEAAGEEDATME
ncbi:hypothetical protein LTR36_009182 [Oleoguttula mirabilis]|uniref:Uncharacterized protein n=1 Tax=Oleoguttula mirabilis TaxID=1507867 RepID=A0AAV9J6U5_9PEZI|nr:hypothetical protein LTR36_009182 [Oleoguttula mirabilis]